MKASARVQSPEDVWVTITVTAPLKEWKEFRKQLGEWKAPWPAYDFQKVISDVVLAVEQTTLADTEHS